jgi:hypothetical protein
MVLGDGLLEGGQFMTVAALTKGADESSLPSSTVGTQRGDSCLCRSGASSETECVGALILGSQPTGL